MPCSINRNIDQDNDDQVTKNQQMTQNGQQMTRNNQQMTKDSQKMTKNDNYVEMAPAHVSDDQLPLRPFEPIDYRNRKSMDIDEPVDPISLRLQVQFPINAISVSPVSISVIIITRARLPLACGLSDAINHVRFLYICRVLGHLS